MFPLDGVVDNCRKWSISQGTTRVLGSDFQDVELTRRNAKYERFLPKAEETPCIPSTHEAHVANMPLDCQWTSGGNPSRTGQ